MTSLIWLTNLYNKISSIGKIFDKCGKSTVRLTYRNKAQLTCVVCVREVGNLLITC